MCHVAFKNHPHVLGLQHGKALARQNDFSIGWPDAESQSPYPTHCARMTVTTGKCATWKGQTQFRRYDMNDPLPVVIQVEEWNSVAPAALAELFDEFRTSGHGWVVIAAGESI